MGRQLEGQRRGMAGLVKGVVERHGLGYWALEKQEEGRQRREQMSSVEVYKGCGVREEGEGGLRDGRGSMSHVVRGKRMEGSEKTWWRGAATCVICVWQL